jgi:hypothetical protein
LGRLDALGLPPITDEEIEEELQAARRQRSAAHELNPSN